jgi:hypothetical protein
MDADDTDLLLAYLVTIIREEEGERDNVLVLPKVTRR